MQDFRKDTKEIIEKQYMAEILQFFPNYATFWNEFIGQKIGKSGYLEPYGLKIPKTLKRSLIVPTYIELTQAHYSMFCQLAGAHYQLLNLIDSLKIMDRNKRTFIHLECLESLYMHLANALYQEYHIFNLTHLLRTGKKGSKKQLKISLRNKKIFLSSTLNKIEREVVMLRNNIVHFGRLAFMIFPNDYALPAKTKPNRLWKEQLRSKSWLETTKKAKNDLIAVEKIINKLHTFIISLLEVFINKKGIKIKY